MEKPFGPLIGKEAIQIIILPGKEGVEIHFPLFLLGFDLQRQLLFFLHKIPLTGENDIPFQMIEIRI
jgi:hypothetical protein